jgi:hypothetical protein
MNSPDGLPPAREQTSPQKKVTTQVDGFNRITGQSGPAYTMVHVVGTASKKDVGTREIQRKRAVTFPALPTERDRRDRQNAGLPARRIVGPVYSARQERRGAVRRDARTLVSQLTENQGEIDH